MSGAAGTSNKGNHQRDNFGLYERRIGTKEGGGQNCSPSCSTRKKRFSTCELQRRGSNFAWRHSNKTCRPEGVKRTGLVPLADPDPYCQRCAEADSEPVHAIKTADIQSGTCVCECPRAGTDSCYVASGAAMRFRTAYFSFGVGAHGARARGCYACANFQGQFNVKRLLCERDGRRQVISAHESPPISKSLKSTAPASSSQPA